MDLEDSLASQEKNTEQPTPVEEKTKKSEDKILLDPAFLKELEELKNEEERITHIFSFIDNALSLSPPKFKDFWEGRKLLLELLKNLQNPTSRSAHWERLTLSTQEARRKKEDLQKESAYAEEQIEMAISSLEKEIESGITAASFTDEPFANSPHIPKESQTLFLEEQGLLNSLNAFATHINALRKELIRTNMRIRTKNQFFDRLSTLGNTVFPKRKELIQSVSSRFADEVIQFVKEAKNQLNPRQPMGAIRDQIKEMQKLAKLFTLNTFAFNETRTALSSLWDMIKEQEKERKKEFAERKEESTQQMQEFFEELAKIVVEIEESSITTRAAEERLSALLSKLKRTRLDRYHARDIREKIMEVKEPIDKKLDEEVEEFNRREREKEEARKKEVQDFLQKLDDTLEKIGSNSIDSVEEQQQLLKNEKQTLSCNTQEKRDIEQSFKKIQSALAEKREELLLNLPTKDKEYLQNLIEVQKQRAERKKEIKARLEGLKRSKATSGLDFEQALLIDAQEQEEKEELEKVISGLVEIEEKIAAFKSQT